MEGGRREELVGRKCDCGRKSQRDTTLLGWKVREGAKSQGMWEVCRSQKEQKMNSSLEP